MPIVSNHQHIFMTSDAGLPGYAASPHARAEEEARLRRLFSEPGSASEVTDPGPRVDRLAGIPTLDEIRVQIEQARQKIDALREAVRKRR